jgi:hypothetical protein
VTKSYGNVLFRVVRVRLVSAKRYHRDVTTLWLKSEGRAACGEDLLRRSQERRGEVKKRSVRVL